MLEPGQDMCLLWVKQNFAKEKYFKQMSTMWVPRTVLGSTNMDIQSMLGFFSILLKRLWEQDSIFFEVFKLISSILFKSFWTVVLWILWETGD